MNDRLTELRLVLDVTGPAGDDLIGVPIHLGKRGVAGGVEAMLKEAARHFPARVQSPDGVLEQLTSDISPLVSLVLYLCSQANRPIKPPLMPALVPTFVGRIGTRSELARNISLMPGPSR